MKLSRTSSFLSSGCERMVTVTAAASSASCFLYLPCGAYVHFKELSRQSRRKTVKNNRHAFCRGRFGRRRRLRLQPFTRYSIKAGTLCLMAAFLLVNAACHWGMERKESGDFLFSKHKCLHSAARRFQLLD